MKQTTCTVRNLSVASFGTVVPTVQVSAIGKNIDFKLKFIKALECGSIFLEFIESADNVADILTKIIALPS